MRTDLISFVLASENRKKIVKTLFDYPERQWSCSTLEGLTKLSHATVFRTLKGLANFCVLKTLKINKKTIIYELVKNHLVLLELKKLMDIEKTASEKIARDFTKRIISKGVYSVILYGSAVKGEAKPESDIDVLVVLNKTDYIQEKTIFNMAAKLSSQFNKTISPVITTLKELNILIKNNDFFAKSIKTNMEVLYGKNPFRAS